MTSLHGEFEYLSGEVVAWANATFPDRTPQSAFIKFFEEIGELVRDPSAPGEYADVMIMLIDLADMYKVDLLKAIRDKLAINYDRTWVKGPNGTLQHAPDDHA